MKIKKETKKKRIIALSLWTIICIVGAYVGVSFFGLPLWLAAVISIAVMLINGLVV